MTKARFDWDPDQYGLFVEERLRPALELLARLPVQRPELVCDLGCGTGVPTLELRRRWPQARILAVDRSASMLERARLAESSIEWIEADIGDWRPPEPVDVLFSNAALHWVGDHRTLFPRLLEEVAPGGFLAVQMPASFDEPSHRAMIEVARLPRWRDRLAEATRWDQLLEADAYLDMLLPLAREVDVWKTTYHHLLEGEDPIVEFFKGSALRSFLSRLDEEAGRDFVARYRNQVAGAYPRRSDGITVLPFQRIFVIAQRPVRPS